MPNEPEEIRKQWFNALRRENISDLKHVFVCIHHFHDNDVERTYKIPNPDGSLSEIPSGQPKLKKGAIPSLLPGCAPYYSESTSKPTRLSFNHKEDIHFQKGIILSRESQQIEELKYRITSLAGLKEYLFHLTLPTDWYSWFSHDRIRIINPLQSQGNVTISIRSYISIDSSLNVSAFQEQEIPLSITTLEDTRQITCLIDELESKSIPTPSAKTIASDISIATNQVRKAIRKLESEEVESTVTSNDNNFENELILSRHQFILCQLENLLAPKNRRRYNVITQVIALKSHLLSPACYNYLQSLGCLTLPHYHTLQKLYSSLGLDSEFMTYLKEATCHFSLQEKNVILQMDEIHIKSESSYKGGQIINPPLEANNPTKSVFAIMASSLHKKWSSIIRLLPIFKTSAQELFPIIRKVICDIELLGISVQVICTDNNPLNVHLFKLFSPDGKTLQSCVVCTPSCRCN